MSVERGANDHHLLIFSFSKTSFTKIQPNQLHYHKYKSFDEIVFLKYVPNLSGKKIIQNGKKNQFLRVLNKHAPLKSKVIRKNNKPFVTKTLRKAIMQKSALKKKANNLNDLLAIKLYKKQKLCSQS